MSSLKMPFGKYKGKRLNKLPLDYLVWCRDKCDNLTDELRAAVEEELADRTDKPEEEGEELTTRPEVARAPKVSPLGQTLAGDVRMLFRNLASMDVEETIRANPLDGVVLMCGCDKTTPSLVMGAASCDIPALVISGGPKRREKSSWPVSVASWPRNTRTECSSKAARTAA